MPYNEAETRLYLIDPKLRAKGYDDPRRLRLETPAPVDIEGPISRILPTFGSHPGASTSRRPEARGEVDSGYTQAEQDREAGPSRKPWSSGDLCLILSCV